MSLLILEVGPRKLILTWLSIGLLGAAQERGVKA